LPRRDHHLLMQLLPLTLDTLAGNLALDEALLDAAEAKEIEPGVLRLWESASYGVVLGRSSSAETEVDLHACRQDGIPVYRRSSGGGTIVTGPGCLMVALVLDFETYPQLQTIDAAHRFVLNKLACLLARPPAPNVAGVRVAGVRVAGISDLVIQPTASAPARKFSGNAMRCKRSHLLYHGTLLYDFDLQRISRWLATPTRTPDYRHDREHVDFIANLPLARQAIVDRLIDGWQAQELLPNWPEQRTKNLVQSKYIGDPKWVVSNPST